MGFFQFLSIYHRTAFRPTSSSVESSDSSHELPSKTYQRAITVVCPLAHFLLRNLHTHNSEPMHSTILGGIVASLALFAAPVVARGRYAGGIDMNEACRHQYGEGTWAFSDGNSAYDWHCTSGPHSEWVDTNGYCGWKYGCGAQSDAQGGGLNDWACYCAT